MRRRFRRLALILPLVLLSGFPVAACSSDPGAPTADDFDGLWLITSVTAQVGELTLTVRRDGTPLAVRGDVVFTPITENTATLSIRQLSLDDNVPQGPLISRRDAVALDGQQWVLTEETGEVSVYTAVLDGNNLALEWDPSDPRNMRTASPPEEILARRAPPWPTTTVGGWEQDTGCIFVPAIGEWARFEAQLEISTRHLADLTLSSFVHMSTDCTDPVTPSEWTQRGLLEEDAETVRGWWLELLGGRTLEPRFEELQFSLSGDELSTTTIDCDPAPQICSAFPIGSLFDGVWLRAP